MSKLWGKDDKRPVNNSIEKELNRLERVVLALHIAVAEKRKKHYEQDFEELGNCIAELRRLLNELNN